MPYTTIADLVKRLDPQILAGLADDTRTPPELAHPETQAVLNQAIADGGGLIDSYLLGCVDLGHPEVQLSLERINATLALYFLYRRRYLSESLNPLGPAREAVSAHLAAVARGQARLADGADGTPEREVFSTTEETARVLDTNQLVGY